MWRGNSRELATEGHLDRVSLQRFTILRRRPLFGIPSSHFPHGNPGAFFFFLHHSTVQAVYWYCIVRTSSILELRKFFSRGGSRGSKKLIRRSRSITLHAHEVHNWQFWHPPRKFWDTYFFLSVRISGVRVSNIAQLMFFQNPREMRDY